MHAGIISAGKWEYKEAVVNDLQALQQEWAEGWEIVSAVPVPLTRAAGKTGTLWLRRTLIPLTVVVALLLLAVCAFTFLVPPRSTDNNIPISQLVADVENGRVAKIVSQEDSNVVTIYYKSSAGGSIKTSVKPPEDSIVEYLQASSVPSSTISEITIEVERASSLVNYVGLAGFCLPPLFTIGAVVWATRMLVYRAQRWNTLVILRRRISKVRRVPADENGPAEAQS